MKGRISNPWSWFTEARLTYALKVLLIVVLAIYVGEFVLGFLARIAGVVYVVIGSIFFAYLIFPVIQRLRRRMPLLAALAIVYASILLLIVLAAYLIVPRIIDETAALSRQFPDLVRRLTDIIYNPGNPVTAHLPDWVRAEITRTPNELLAFAKQEGVNAFQHAIPVIFGTFAVIAAFVVVPLITAYLLLDLDNLRLSISTFVPQDRWRATFDLLSDIDAAVGGYIRGQVLVAITVAIMFTIALTILHVPYSFLLGLLAGVGDLIPYLGAVLAFLPAFSSALVANGLPNALGVTATFIVLYELEGHFIAPYIMSKNVKLSALAVLLSVLVGAELGGIVGMLIAVPVVSILRIIILRMLARPTPVERPPSL
jgi:predicted PurR-regulated permease PerM